MTQPPSHPQPSSPLSPLSPSDSPPPPAYGDSLDLDHISLSRAGFQAGAALTSDGRINISISEKNHRLSQLLAPALRNQLSGHPPSPITTTTGGPLPPPYIPTSLGGHPGQTPPPKLNVVIQIVGSRGDVQPFVALGQTLKQTYGHRVRVATHPVFQKFVEESGLEFFSIGGDPAELMAFMVKHPGLMPGFDAIKTGEVTKRRKGVMEVLMGCWRSCFEAGDGTGPPPREWKKGDRNAEGVPVGQDGWTVSSSSSSGTGGKPFVADAIIANPPSFAHIHCAEKLGIPLHMMFTMPWSPTRAFAHPLANIEASNADVNITNYISYALVEMMTWQGLGDVINRFREKVLDLEPLSLLWAPGLLTRLRIPTTYCWSPALIPKPNDWAQEISVAGFYFLDLATNYTPEPDLAAFLAAGPPPVYIGFGSIVVDDPDALTRLILRAVAKSGVRALISKGWGGIGLTEDITQADWAPRPDQYFMLGNCPHDWLFNRVSAVVHHGGAGTSAAGIKAGKPTVVVPFFGDQPFWGAMIAKSGAGPKPIPNKELTAENLAAAIQEALKPETLARAKELGNKIKEEKGADEGGKTFHQFLDVDALRCSLSPSRVATWRVRRTKVRLSAFAAEVLVREGLLQYSDLKLFRAKEHITDGQPWDPITAVTAALVEDLGTMAMSVADFPRGIFKAKEARRARNLSGGNGQALGSETPADGAHGASSPQAHGALSPESQPGSSYFPPTAGDTAEGASRSASDVKGKGKSVPSGTHSRNDSFRGSFNQRSTSGGGGPSTPGGTANMSGAASPQLNPEAFSYKSARDATSSVGRLVDTGMKMPMNVCLGLARGFRNAPRLYNDDTVRPQEKVTDFASGVRVATREFGFGMYDGLSGLVTQPMRGAEKEGTKGLLKGFAKGIGGVFLKPGAAIWSIPAYTMQGLNAEVRKLFSGGGWMNHIMTARAQQGREEMEHATREEVKDVVARWQEKRWEDVAKGGVQGKGKGVVSPGTPAGGAGGSSGQGQARSGVAAVVGASNDAELERAIQASIQQTSNGDPQEDARVEAAIRLSLAQMQHQMASQAQQPPQHDGTVPARYSDLKSPPGGWSQSATGPPPPSSADVASPAAQPPAYSADYQQHPPPPEKSSLAQAMIDEYFTGISDEEYQALIEEAVQQSIRAQMNQPSTMSAEEEKDLLKAIEASKSTYTFGDVPPPPPAYQSSGFTSIATPSIPNNGEAGGGPEEEEEEMRKALEESERMDRERREQEEREKQEEAIVLEWVKRQSLAEERFRGGSQRGLGGGEGSGGGGGGGGGSGGGQGQVQRQTQAQTQEQGHVPRQYQPAQVQSESRGQELEGNFEADEHHGPIQMEDRDYDEEEEFRRALEESMRISGQGDSRGQ
ncbi:hypothetical protein NEUTE1DRAFT_70206 [Neurospora tetrasperma FGSC 2508]|uniref:Uncharacterized protein n=1 Tax=Neurospora tetrasperma (strain FGSC 2508 / ATCC MYA-4615 / P0657) TaxID=510951 RepID=F8MYR2_NEUT8|nr:uncharacterized protein NEUTE1DRAFT_70206 [Neurospora tetrasperma FGSC 2508]EGO51459.1 hypothetical protein NEUTE1DRAFT_70206 [Neurospora tetrasperma FGSC 2508]EGZ78559.1 UDP-Glycosyltransferase/glycogen phosphorylase [Neurospora tetrasperma FGSC 2509]